MFSTLKNAFRKSPWRAVAQIPAASFKSQSVATIPKDHREIGHEQMIFMTHPLSPGNAFMLPHGMRIVNTLFTYLRDQYRMEGYQEVSSPLIFHRDLWVKSGHWEKYKDDMFAVNSLNQLLDEEEMGLKPMNCPGHCLMYLHTLRSYRELPLRFAEFTPLHRNEVSGSLTGLTRLRKFQQDDAHIFCMKEQIGGEVSKCLSFMERVYSRFGFSYTLSLSTRPEKYIGEIGEWDEAESMLTRSLEINAKPFTIKAKDGAFYGPKIDVTLTDSSGKAHQTATIQLDFQLPRRFDLQYQDSYGSRSVPVMIHRAIFGSVERMIAILMEHFQGKWPFWLNPRQIMICSVGNNVTTYVKQIEDQLTKSGYFVDIELSPHDTLSKRIRQAQLLQYNYIIIVGDKEKNNQTCSIRERDGNIVGELSLTELETFFAKCK